MLRGQAAVPPGGSPTFNLVTATSYKLTTKAGAFVVGDVPLGSWIVGFDSSGGTTKVYANPAGVLLAVALA